MKKALSNTFNIAALYIGNVGAAITPLLMILAASYNSMTGQESLMPNIDSRMLGPLAFSLAGLGVAALGYTRFFGNRSEELRRGAMAHCFNFAATTAGTFLTVPTIFNLEEMITHWNDFVANYPDHLAIYAATSTVGLALITAGYSRAFGKPPAAPQSPDIKP